MKGWQIALIAGVLGLLALFYRGLWGDPKYIPTVLVNTPAHTFEGPEVRTGDLISLDRFKGKVVVLNFWASWCVECRLEHENLQAIHQKFSSDPNFVMLGINYQDREEDARDYLETYGTDFRHVRDLKGTISIDYGVYGVPETFIIDRQGVIRYKQVGPIVGPTYTYLTEKVLPPLLHGQPPQA